MSSLHVPRQKRLQFNVSMTLFHALKTPRRVIVPCPIMGRKEELVLEDEQELDQFYLDMKQIPISEEAFNKAFDQLKAMFKYNLNKNGLIFS